MSNALSRIVPGGRRRSREAIRPLVALILLAPMFSGCTSANHSDTSANQRKSDGASTETGSTAAPSAPLQPGSARIIINGDSVFEYTSHYIRCLHDASTTKIEGAPDDTKTPDGTVAVWMDGDATIVHKLNITRASHQNDQGFTASNLIYHDGTIDNNGFTAGSDPPTPGQMAVTNDRNTYTIQGTAEALNVTVASGSGSMSASKPGQTYAVKVTIACKSIDAF